MVKFKYFLLLIFILFITTSIFAEDANRIYDAAFQKAQEIKKQGVSFDITTTKKKKKEIFNGKIYIKNDKIRIEDEKKLVIIIGNFVYTMSANIEKNEAIMKYFFNEKLMKKYAFHFSKEPPKELIFIEKGYMNNYSCNIVKARGEKGEKEYYFTNNYGIPTYVKEGNFENNMTNFVIGKIDDNLFEIPNLPIIDCTLDSLAYVDQETGKPVKTNSKEEKKKNIIKGIKILTGI